MSTQVDADSLWKYLEGICRWERYTGARGENEAVAYVEAELSALGVDVVVHEFASLISVPGAASLEVEGARIPAITAAFGASTGEEGVRGSAVYVGRGRSARHALHGALLHGHGGATPRWRGASSWRRAC